MERESWIGMRKIAEACWAQARANYAAAVTLLDAGVYFASVFFAQQAAEQALRAANVHKLQKIPRGHNLIQMCNSLEAPLEIMNAAAELNPEFLATRSPEAVTGVPAQNYDRKSARLHLRSAQSIVDWIKASIY
ncbi:MAG: HEPN domain-containing protein [Armatimonadetes bacterium]|nr:HEPN domain-containing protein [Armatimonadota bacterium]